MDSIVSENLLPAFISVVVLVILWDFFKSLI